MIVKTFDYRKFDNRTIPLTSVSKLVLFDWYKNIDNDIDNDKSDIDNEE